MLKLLNADHFYPSVGGRGCRVRRRAQESPVTAAETSRRITPGAPASAEYARRVRAARPTRDQRAAAGKAIREVMPLADHSEISRGARADPVDLLESQAAQRVPQLVPIRYGRMLATPFTFFRGGALIMAADLGLDTAFRADRAALRGRAPEQFRLLFDAGTEPGLRHQRLRRDLSRAVRMGRQTAGRQRRRGVADRWLLPEESQVCRAGHRHRLPEGDPPARAD